MSSFDKKLRIYIVENNYCLNIYSYLYYIRCLNHSDWHFLRLIYRKMEKLVVHPNISYYVPIIV